MRKTKIVFLFLMIITAYGVKANFDNKTTETLAGKNLYTEERCNDNLNLEVARKIGTLGSVKETAVLSRGHSILVGVVLDDGVSATGKAEEVVREIIGGYFSGLYKADIEIGNKKAKDVVELALCIDSGVEEQYLEKRFEYLYKAD